MTAHSSPPTETSGIAIDPRLFRSAAGNFVTGVTIATTIGEDGQPRGATVNSFTTVSLAPPLILFCVGRTSRSFAAFDAAQSFAINVLSAGQRQLSSTFASKTEDKFAGVDWARAVTGSPVFAESLTSFDCVLHEKIEAGDHIVLIGRVVDLQCRTGTPLGYFSGNYIDFDIQRETVDAASAPGHCYGGLFHHDGRLFFLEEDGQLTLPFGTTLGEEHREPDSLLGQLDRIGVHARASFVYAVFSEPGREGLATVYLGEIDRIDDPAAGGFRLFDPSELPFEKLPRLSGLVKRYIREKAEDKFGLYVGTAARGLVHRVR